MHCKSRITSLGRPLLTWAIIGSWHEPIECSQRLQAHTCCCPKVIVTQICSHVASAKVYIIINFHFEPFKTLLMHLLGDKKSPICFHAVNTCGPKMLRWKKMLNSAILALYSAISIPKQMNEFLPARRPAGNKKALKKFCRLFFGFNGLFFFFTGPLIWFWNPPLLDTFVKIETVTSSKEFN